MRRALALVMSLSLATQAQALSCMVPDPIRDFKEAHASEERWSAVVGRLDFDESRLPKGVAVGEPAPGRQPTDLRGQMVGEFLGPDGFVQPFQGNVTVRVSCYLSWCGGARSGGRYLAFLKHEDGKRVVQVQPCGQWLYQDPSPALLDAVHACFAGGPCEEGQSF